MADKDPRIDAYIEKSADFAKPVLIHFRELVHRACPEVEEKIKWGFPNFDYKGKTMVSMVAFKQHCAITFRKAALIKDFTINKTVINSLGRITKLKELPSNKKILTCLKEAMALQEKDISNAG